MATAENAAAEITRSLALLWGTESPPAKGPKRGLTLDQIVDTAINIADHHGLEAVSMRRLATELAVGTMTLYRYLPGRAELIELMADGVEVFPDTIPAADNGWRAHVAACAHGSRALYLQHPWLMTINRSRPLIGPNALRSFERYLSGLAKAPLADREKMILISAVDSLVIGSARHQLLTAEAERTTGLSETEFWTMQEPFITDAMTSGAYPTFAGLAEDAFSAGWDETFELGLSCMLDGWAAIIDRRPAAQATKATNAPRGS